MKIGKTKIGFGNKYKTINPLVLVARVVATKFAAKDPFSAGDDSNDYWISEMASFGSSNAHLLGFPIYGGDYKGEKIVEFIYNKLKPISDWKHRQYYRFKRQPHRLTLLNIDPTSWADTDTRMFHAMFTLLGTFVERELGKISEEYKKEYPDCDYKGYRLHCCGGTDEKAIDLWLWYTIELPKEKEGYSEYLDRKYCDMKMVKGDGTFSFQGVDRKAEGHEKYEPEDERHLGFDYIEAMQDKKFMELVDLRRSLWT